MADQLQKLLMFIVENPLMRQESRDAQLGATAVQDVRDEIQSIAQNQREDAERLAEPFARGLRLAAQNGGALVLDDTDPESNAIADALARFLVSTNLASSQSTPTSEDHYSYRFDIDWEKLRRVAGAAEVDLDAALALRS